VVPPYEGRREKADSSESFTESDELTSPEPDDTPGGRTASPADEQPAKDMPETKDDDPGVGPAHVPGTPAAEDGGR
jgi:hypothetical protein